MIKKPTSVWLRRLNYARPTNKIARLAIDDCGCLCPLVDATLLNTQKTDVFEGIKKLGIDPSHFVWDATDATGGPTTAKRTVSRLKSATDMQFYFLFDFAAGYYYPRCSPWDGVRQANLGKMSWPQGSLPAAVHWANLVEKELNTPDPWAALPDAAARTGIAVAAEVSNTEFSHRETAQLQTALEDIKKLLIHSIGTSDQKAQLVNQQLSSLLESSKRMGRKDWTNLAIGTLLTLGLQLALPPEIVRQAFEILKNALSGIVQLMPQIIATSHHLTA